MRFNSWYRNYHMIAKYLGLKVEMDLLSAFCLSDYLGENIANLKAFERINNSKTLVVGAGPSIEEQKVQNYLLNIYETHRNKRNKLDNSQLVIMVADGAAELLLELGIIPDFVISDLDGNYESLISANQKGSIMVIHAHGDNIQKIKSLISNFNNIIGTTQTFPFKNIFNFGGFTDGDRCVFLAEEFLAKEIILIGMDFDSSIGHYSKRIIVDIAFKRKKLFVAKNLIESLSKQTICEIVNVSSSKYGSSIYGVTKNIII